MLYVILIAASIVAADKPVTIKVIDDRSNLPIQVRVTIFINPADPNQAPLVEDQETDKNGKLVTSALSGLGLTEVWIGVAPAPTSIKNPARCFHRFQFANTIVVRVKEQWAFDGRIIRPADEVVRDLARPQTTIYGVSETASQCRPCACAPVVIMCPPQRLPVYPYPR
jgi:hypothetical protein